MFQKIKYSIVKLYLDFMSEVNPLAVNHWNEHVLRDIQLCKQLHSVTPASYLPLVQKKLSRRQLSLLLETFLRFDRNRQKILLKKAKRLHCSIATCLEENNLFKS